MTLVIFTEDSIRRSCLTNLSDQEPYSSAHLATAHKNLVQVTAARDAGVLGTATVQTKGPQDGYRKCISL